MILGKPYGGHLKVMHIRSLMKDVFVTPPQKYYKGYYKESLCQIPWVYTKIDILVKDSINEK